MKLKIIFREAMLLQRRCAVTPYNIIYIIMFWGHQTQKNQDTFFPPEQNYVKYNDWGNNDIQELCLKKYDVVTLANKFC